MDASLNKLSKTSEIITIVSFNNSDALLGLNTAVDSHQIPFLAATATHPDITKGGVYTQQFLFDDGFQGKVSSLFVSDELLMTRAAIISNVNRKYSQYLSGEFEKQFINDGGEITTHLKIDGDNPVDAHELMKELMRGSPEVVYLPIRHQLTAKFLKAISDVEWSVKVMVSDGSLDGLIEDDGVDEDDLEGLISIDVYSEAVPLAENEVLEYKRFRRSDHDINAFKVLGVEVGMFIAQAIDVCSREELDRRCIRNAYRNTDNMSGLIGLISMGEDGKAKRPVVVSEYRDGSVEFLVKVY